MKKIIVIIGCQNSGKTEKAKEIASRFEKDEVVFIDYVGHALYANKYPFSKCTKKTKLVVFEGLIGIDEVKKFFMMVSDPITVNVKTEKPFDISPKFVLVCESDIDQEQISKLGASFHSRFEFIFCKHIGISDARLMDAARPMYEALKEIAEGKGRYDTNRLKHAENTIEDMIKIAKDAIERIN